MDKQWFAVRTKSNREQITAGSLCGQGYETFLPLCTPAKTKSPERMTRQPLFPGYLFCRFDLRYRLPILQTSGVVHIVSIGSVPAPLRDDEIESLRIVIESEADVDRYPSLVAGQLVKLTEGPLAGARGIIVRSGGKLLVVSITLLQRSVSVSVAREWLDSAIASN